jgi:hypothetical protein
VTLERSTSVRRRSGGEVISWNDFEGAVEVLGRAWITIHSRVGYFHRVPNRALMQNVVRK